ncbi:MAG: DNA-binding protein WhiA [Clostridia bacterium]
MTFAGTVKKEILKNFKLNPCCYVASLSAFIHSAGSLNISSGMVTYSVSADNKEVIDFVLKVSSKLAYADLSNTKIVESSIAGNPRYEVKIDSEYGMKLLSKTSIISIADDGRIEINRGTDNYLLSEDCCKRAYIKSAFLGAGSVSVPCEVDFNAESSHNSGYHFEMEFTSEEQANSILELLCYFNIFAKKIERRDNFVVYLKESESISDMLSLLGATVSMLELQNEKAKRELRNNVNRQSNCINANIDRAVNASFKQMEVIGIIETTVGLMALSPALYEVVELRKRYPESSLQELAEISGLSKSTINQRFRNLARIAIDISGGDYE